MTNELPKLTYSKKEAAEMLGLKQSSIEWLLRKGNLPHRKISNKIRFTMSDLQSLIETCAVTQCCATE